MNLWQNVATQINRLSRALSVIGCICFAMQAIYITISIISRAFFRIPISSADELTRAFLVWGTMSGMALCLQEGRHIRITAFVGLLSQKIQNRIAIFTDLIAIGVLIIFVIESWNFTMFSRALGEGSSGVLEYPIWWTEIALPIGGFCFILQYLVKIAGEIFERRPLNGARAS
ncbi:MAG: TRAP transporter small permease [Deltaproteobacteria bacterium]|nr:TRAP transporter small permease [Deltaproteobacteria bacterium]